MILNFDAPDFEIKMDEYALISPPVSRNTMRFFMRDGTVLL